MNVARRKVILSSLFGAGWVGLRALATGLPITMFMEEGVARADDPPPTCAAKQQYLLLLTSAGGDPLNANVPGCYVDPGIYHPTDPAMAATAMTVGGASVKAAKPWAALPESILSRTCFFHHSTYTNNHGDAPKVNRLMGAVNRQEMLVSLIAKNTAPCLKTVQTQPVVLNNNLITYSGAVLPVLSPPNLQAALSSPTGPLANLQKIRDTHLDQMNALLKSTGNTAQRNILDQYASSQQQARSLSQQLLTDLAAVTGTSRTDINIATAVLFKMNVSPVACATYGFGGDNHGDVGLAGETSETIASLAALPDLFTRLTSYGLQDTVTIAFQNVFGRTLSTKSRANGNADGRDHNANHHCSVLIGSAFKSSLIGGVTPNDTNTNFQALPINSSTGAGSTTGDIPYEETLGAVGKTLCAAVGMDQGTIDAEITLGKVIKPALV